MWLWGWPGKVHTKAEELSRPPTPPWPIAPRLSCSRPWDPEFTKVEAKEGSLLSTTRLLTRLWEPEGTPVPSDPSVNSKWDTASLILGSGSREMGGISKTSSPRLGVWNVCYMWGKKETIRVQFSVEVITETQHCFSCRLNWPTHLSRQKRVARSTDGEITVAAFRKLKQSISTSSC